MRKIVTTGLCCAAFAGALAAQQAAAPQQPAQPRPLPGITVEVRNIYNNIKGFITRSADAFPEDKYKWQPTPDVRSWSRLIGHIIDDNNGSCWAMGGLTAAPARFDTPNSNESGAFGKPKADIVKMLAGSFALCDTAFDTLTEANMSERNGTSNRSKFGAMFYNTQHINEHYGNIVTYMRLQGLVPPSSAPRGGGPASH